MRIEDVVLLKEVANDLNPELSRCGFRVSPLFLPVPLVVGGML